MPCWTVQTMSVEFQAKHKDLLEKAILKLGWQLKYIDNGKSIVVGEPSTSFTIDLANKKATILSSQQSQLNRLKQAYSQQAVQKVAQLNKWQMRASANNPMKGVLIRS